MICPKIFHPLVHSNNKAHVDVHVHVQLAVSHTQNTKQANIGVREHERKYTV